MRAFSAIALLTCLGPAIPAVAQPGTQDSPTAAFTRDVRPILERSCWNCHGAASQASDLDLRSRDKALRGGQRGPAIVPGRALDSRFYRVVAGIDEPAMPMEGAALTVAEIEAVRNWIDEGAHWDDGSSTTATDALASLEGASGTGCRSSFLPGSWWVCRGP